MKNRTALIISFLAILGCSARAYAAYGYGAAQELHFDDDKSVQRRLELMSKKLQLTPDQGFRVRQALEDQATKIDLLRKEYLDARKRIADDTNGSFMGILNPSQQEAYQKIKIDVVGVETSTPSAAGPWREPR